MPLGLIIELDLLKSDMLEAHFPYENYIDEATNSSNEYYMHILGYIPLINIK